MRVFGESIKFGPQALWSSALFSLLDRVVESRNERQPLLLAAYDVQAT
jgi:hypothetical protein